MKKNFYRNLACMLIFTGGLCIATSTKAQVTVGSKGIPNAGALLDMKQKDKTDGSANSDKGLGLPCVALTAVDKLDPCVATTGNATKDDTAKKSHIGLTVYNTTDNTSTDATLIEGVYAWDGTMWTQYSGSPAGGAENGLSMNGRKVILGGTLNQPTTITGDAANNLTLETPTTIDETLTVTGATTIGMNTTTPTVGALLEIRNKQQDLTGVADVLDPKMVTSDKGGLLLPRVQLVNLASLEPFITGADAETKLSLAGLMVYNIAVSGDKIYPALYVWSGTSWGTSQQSASTLVIDNSVGARVKPFTFYELGTETTTSTPVKFEPLKVTITGAFGTPKYQWYQVTGNNVHIRAGSKIIGATSAEFYPVDGVTFNADGEITSSVSVLKGTTRNANNTGFYKYYCVVSDDYRTVETETVEVAVGCGAKTNSGDWITFMCFNLGADALTMQQHMDMTIPSYTIAVGAATGYTSGQEKVWGDLYQWGRIADGHEKRDALVKAGKPAIGDITSGSVCSGTIGSPNNQVKKGTSFYGVFSSTSGSWSPMSQANIDLLWNGSRFLQNDPCAHYLTTNTLTPFWYDGVTSLPNCGDANTGWRLPQAEEFGAIFKGGTLSDSPDKATANTWTLFSVQSGNSNLTRTRGYMVSPDNVETTLFFPLGGTRETSGTLAYAGDSGAYWTTTLASVDATRFSMNLGTISLAGTHRSRGFSIRCVKQ